MSWNKWDNLSEGDWMTRQSGGHPPLPPTKVGKMTIDTREDCKRARKKAKRLIFLSRIFFFVKGNKLRARADELLAAADDVEESIERLGSWF